MRQISTSVKLCITVITFLMPTLLAAQDDGPRIYWNAPTGTNVIEGYAWFYQSNSLYPTTKVFDPDLVTNGLTALFIYNRYFKLGPRALILTASIPFGNATADIDTSLKQSTRGLSDPYLQVAYNIFGSPAVSTEDYGDYLQGTSLSVLGGISFPLGNYNADQLLNMGQNRFGLRLGVPFIQPIGKWAYGKITTLEVVPSVWFYSDNNAFAGNLTFKQKPVFVLESHITRDITKDLFVSLDYLYQNGGETSLNDINQDNATSSNFLGITLGFMLNEQLQFKFRYLATLRPNKDNDIDGDMLQLNFSYAY